MGMDEFKAYILELDHNQQAQETLAQSIDTYCKVSCNIISILTVLGSERSQNERGLRRCFDESARRYRQCAL